MGEVASPYFHVHLSKLCSHVSKSAKGHEKELKEWRDQETQNATQEGKKKDLKHFFP